MTIHHGLKLAIEECNRCSKRILYSVITGDVSDRKLPDRGFFCLFVCFLRKGFSVTKIKHDFRAVSLNDLHRFLQSDRDGK